MDIEKVNAVLVKAIVGLREGELQEISEAAIGGFRIPTPKEVAKKAKKKKKKRSKQAKCMEKYRNKKGDFDTIRDCIDALSDCTSVKSPEGACAALMVHRVQTKPKGDEEE